MTLRERFAGVLSDLIHLTFPLVEKNCSGGDATDQPDNGDQRACRDGTDQESDNTHANTASVCLNAGRQRAV
jgi:hypothetical protein